MNASDVGRELTYPLSNRALIYAMLFYWFLFGLAYVAKIFGIALLFLTLPAFFRYLLYLLEARANGKSAPVPAIEMFNPADNLWTLTPLLHLGVGIWAGLQLKSADYLAGAAIAGAFAVVFLPASMAVLAVTHSPLASLNPLTVGKMIRACGPAYWFVPTALIALLALLIALYLAGVPILLINLGVSYGIALLFAMTGAVLRAKNIAMQVEIEAPREPDAGELASDLKKHRQKVANHAYGFISRGNRQGGFAHIREWLEKESATEEGWQWFFEEMLRWENKDPALFFAQQYLMRLLEWGSDRAAIKLIARCLYEGGHWRPPAESRDHVHDLLVRHGRDDLLRQLRQ